jgi:uncharacterized protein YbaP (TraB family)
MRRILAVTAAVFFTFAAAAEAPPPAPVSAPPVTDWAPDETVVVSAQGLGPALWHIKKGDSEIWILGTVSPMPKGLSWNSAHLAEIIKGSRVVLTAPKASAGFFETSWFLLTHRGLLSMPDDKKLEDTLPPPLRARFVAARKALSIKADKYEDDPPVLTAIELLSAYNKAHALDSSEPWDTIHRIAKDNKVPVKPVGQYGALGLVKEILRLPFDAQVKCLDAAVAYTEQSTVHNRPLAEAWAAGNLRQIKEHYYPDRFGDCARQVASFGKLNESAVADYLKAIHEALSKPGKTVMLTDIGSLLRTTGVAEQLHKEGAIIEGPAE